MFDGNPEDHANFVTSLISPEALAEIARSRGLDMSVEQIRAGLAGSPDTKQRAAAEADASDPLPNLVNLAASWSGTPIYNVNYTDAKGNVFKPLQAQCSNQAWSCNDDSTEDWYFIEQYPVMTPFQPPPDGVVVYPQVYGGNPIPVFLIGQLQYVYQASTDPSQLRSATQLWPGAPYLGQIQPTNLPNGAVVGTVANPPQTSGLGVILEQPLPTTTQGSTSYTSGVSWSLGGSIGYSSSNGGSATINGGVEVSNSTTVTTPDVSVINNSGTPLYSTTYTFNGGEQPYSTFQTVNSFIFHMPTANRDQLPENDGVKYFPVYFRVCGAIFGFGLAPLGFTFDLDYTLRLPLPPLPE